MALPLIKPVHISHAKSVAQSTADIFVLIVDESDIENSKLLSPELIALDAQTNGVISALTSFGDFDGKWLQTSVSLLPNSKIASRILLVGTGKKTTHSEARARAIGLKIAEESVKLKSSNIVISGSSKTLKNTSNLAQIAFGMSASIYKYPNSNMSAEAKSELEKPFSATLVSDISGAAEAIQKAMILASHTEVCRLFQDGPPNISTPKFIAEQTELRAKKLGLTVNIYGAQKLREMGFNAMLAVAGGSAQEPQFVVVEYKPAQYKKTVAFVGKGLTMDTGGYSIKTPAALQMNMKYDMSGSAVVLNSVLAMAELKLPVRVFAVAALCENMIDAHAFRVGDVITSYSGKTIEVLNTDAEGRVVLSDALSYTARVLKPDYIIEYSTLTGGMITALGHVAAGVFTFGNDSLAKAVADASETSGERTWPMPVWEEDLDGVKSTIADLQNLGTPTGAAQSCAAAAFLKEFTEDIPFAHIDIAGVADNNMGIGYPKKISSGFGIQLSIAIAEKLAV